MLSMAVLLAGLYLVRWPLVEGSVREFAAGEVRRHLEMRSELEVAGGMLFIDGDRPGGPLSDRFEKLLTQLASAQVLPLLNLDFERIVAVFGPKLRIELDGVQIGLGAPDDQGRQVGELAVDRCFLTTPGGTFLERMWHGPLRYEQGRLRLGPWFSETALGSLESELTFLPGRPPRLVGCVVAIWRWGVSSWRARRSGTRSSPSGAVSPRRESIWRGPGSFWRG